MISFSDQPLGFALAMLLHSTGLLSSGLLMALLLFALLPDRLNPFRLRLPPPPAPVHRIADATVPSGFREEIES